MPPAACSSCPGLLCVRAGEGAALVAEQLGLEQLLGQRRAVQRDERPAGRGDARWRKRATTSLPVPDSPSQQHRGLGAATWVACVST